MSKHTPGPWTITAGPDLGGEYTVRAPEQDIGICIVDGDENARLIAAAPEMYSLIEQLSKQNSELGERALLIMMKVQS